MSITWLITNFLAAFLLPPLNGLLLVIAGLFFWHRRPGMARIFATTGALLLCLLAMPVVGGAMLRTLESESLTPADLKQAQAIVVLGGGLSREAPEYGGDTVGEASLVRLRYAAKLQRESGLPLLVTGGNPDGGKLSEAEAMSQVLTREFGVPVRWIEGASNNTRENAQLTAARLKADGIIRVVLVTHAWHMPRALRSFTEAGLSASPAPTSFQSEAATVLDFLPSHYGAARCAIHEWLGLLWYRVRF
jgi:uncharacterized SAM-binding protein YcdF (DUF218 family)